MDNLYQLLIQHFKKNLNFFHLLNENILFLSQLLI